VRWSHLSCDLILTCTEIVCKISKLRMLFVNCEAHFVAFLLSDREKYRQVLSTLNQILDTSVRFISERR